MRGGRVSLVNCRFLLREAIEADVQSAVHLVRRRGTAARRRLRRRAIVTEIWVFEIKSVVCFAASLVDRSLDFDVVTLSLVRLHQNSASDELASFSEKWSSE